MQLALRIKALKALSSSRVDFTFCQLPKDYLDAVSIIVPIKY